LFDDTARAHEAVQAINAVLMSLGAVPVYFLARRLADRWSALLAVLLTLALPSLSYTAAVMTENAFFPLVLLSVLAIVLALERPTVLRQLLVFVPLLLAFETRAQAALFGAVLVTVLLLVPLIDALAAERARRVATFVGGLRTFVVMWAVVLVGGAAAVLYETARGRPLSSLLGSYGGVTSFTYKPGPIARWFFYHLGEIDMYSGVLPFAAFLLLVLMGLRPREGDRAVRLFAIVAGSSVFWFTFTAAAFAANPVGNRIEERYLFHIVPLFFVAFAAWVGRGLPRPWPLAGIAAAAAAALPGTVPWPPLLDTNAVNGAFGLLPLMRLTQRGIDPDSLAEIVTLAALAGAIVWLALPRRFAIVPLVLVAGYVIFIHRPITSFTRLASEASVTSGIGAPHKNWIDRAVGTNAQVTIVFYDVDQTRFWQNEFFNASVDRAISITGGPYDGLPQTLDQLRTPSGEIVAADGAPAAARYVLTNQAIVPVGTVVASDDQRGMFLYRTDGPLRIAARIDGVYPDKWSGATASYTRYGCEGGTVTATMLSDRDLHPQVQTIVATSGARELGRVSYRPELSARKLTVPLVPKNGLCAVTYTVTPTAVPAEVTNKPDTRALGVRFLSFAYKPPS
jgi:Dolichyl-phosphate-mannose-protein mannosyltransferase